MASPRVRASDDAKMSNSSLDHRELMKNAVEQEKIAQESGRVKGEKLWNEVAGRVCIPEKWGQEGFLKEWMDYSLFDALLAPKGVVSAREALIAERQRKSTRCLTMDRRC